MNTKISLAQQTEDACDQLTRYGGTVFNQTLADALWALTNINDDLYHMRAEHLVDEQIDKAVAHLLRLRSAQPTQGGEVVDADAILVAFLGRSPDANDTRWNQMRRAVADVARNGMVHRILESHPDVDDAVSAGAALPHPQPESGEPGRWAITGDGRPPEFVTGPPVLLPYGPPPPSDAAQGVSLTDILFESGCYPTEGAITGTARRIEQWIAERYAAPPTQPAQAASQEGEVDCVGDTEFESYYDQKGYALSHTGSVGEKQRAREAYWHGYLEAQAAHKDTPR